MGVTGFLNFISANSDNTQLIYVIIAVCVAMVATFILTFITNKNIDDTTLEEITNTETSIYSPIKDEVKELKSCSNETFAN